MWRWCILCLVVGALVGYFVSRWEQEQLWYARFFRLVQSGWNFHQGNFSWQAFGATCSEHCQYSVPLASLLLCRSGALKALLPGALSGQLQLNSAVQGSGCEVMPLPPQRVPRRVGNCYYCQREGTYGQCTLQRDHAPRYPGGHVCYQCLLEEPDRFSS